MYIKELSNSHTINYEFSMKGSSWMPEETECKVTDISVESKIIRFDLICNDDYVGSYALIHLEDRYCILDRESDEILIVHFCLSAEEAAYALYKALDISEELSLVLEYTIRDLFHCFMNLNSPGKESYVRA